MDKVVKISCITFAGGLDNDFSVTLGMLTSDWIVSSVCLINSVFVEAVF